MGLLAARCIDGKKKRKVKIAIFNALNLTPAVPGSAQRRGENRTYR